jgi:hypothetical protein
MRDVVVFCGAKAGGEAGRAGRHLCGEAAPELAHARFGSRPLLLEHRELVVRGRRDRPFVGERLAAVVATLMVVGVVVAVAVVGDDL